MGELSVTFEVQSFGDSFGEHQVVVYVNGESILLQPHDPMRFGDEDLWLPGDEAGAEDDDRKAAVSLGWDGTGSHGDWLYDWLNRHGVIAEAEREIRKRIPEHRERKAQEDTDG